MSVRNSSVMLRAIFALTLTFSWFFLFAQPKINSFSPVSGAPGTIVTLSGTGFNTTVASNVVYFGGVKASINSASSTSLNVVVPFGASTNLITSINLGTGLSGVSKLFFKITIAGGFLLDNNSFSGHSNLTGSGYLDQGANAISSADLDGDGKSELILQKNYSIQIYRNLSSDQTISFSNPINYFYGNVWGKIVPGDVNADGKLDLIFASGTEIRVLINNSTLNNFQFNEIGPYSLPSGSGEIAFADLDNNGLLDIVSTNTGSNSFSILRNTTSGGNVSYAAAQSIATGTEPIGISVADLNADGKNDIVVTNSTSSTISIFRNTTTTPGTITFAAKVDQAIFNARLNLIADIDGDSKPDILVSGSGTFAAFRNTSTVATSITMAARQDIVLGVGFAMGDMVPGDFDGDGKLDIVLAGSGSGGANNTADIRIMRNTSTVGTLAFSSSNSYRFCSFNYSNGTYYGCSFINSLVTSDLDSDGKPDIATSQVNYSTFSRNIINEPNISNFSPTSGTNGTSISISGSKFNEATAVKFGDIPATSFVVNTASKITAEVAGGATGKISVTTPHGTGQSASTFTYYALPTITSFSPTIAGAGTTVTINGTNFSAISSIKFGGVEKASANVLSTTQITAVVGSGATGDVTVTNPSGTATLSGFTFVPLPTIASFSPTATNTGTVVQINGTNFSTASTVKFGNIAASSFNVISATRIDAVVPANAQNGSVSVTTIGGTASLGGFTFTPQPVINSFSPTSGKSGTNVTISGNYFNGVTSVKFGGVAANSFTFVSNTTITAVVANGASGDVAVTTGGGTGTKPGFVYYPLPVINSFTPTSTGTGNNVTITGQGFTGATLVSFGGVNASTFTVVNSTTITAKVASGASGNVVITTPGGTATLSGFTYILPPTLTLHAPASAGAGTLVTITGTNLTGASSVSFGGVPAISYTVVSPTSITATVGTGANGNIVVITPGGTATRAGFTFIQAPTISSFSPTTATIQNTITITGSNFSGATAVSFGGVPANSFSVSSSTQISATAAAGSASGTVSVTTPGGTGTLGGFTFIPPPIISSFSPMNGIAGSVVTINGSNFNNITGVRFGGTNATSYTVVSPTKITAVVGAGTSGSISVLSSNGTGSLVGFLHTAISNFSPTSATIGATITIYGTNLSGTTAVSFGGVPATSFINVNSSTVTAVVANGSTGSVSLTTPAGAISKTGFTYIIPTPTISSFSPTSATNRDVVTITGNHFSGASAVKFGNLDAYSFTVVNNTTIVAIVAHGASGSVNVTTAGGTGTLAGFTYVPSPPAISSFSPASTCTTSTVVTIRGLNFTGTTKVQFEGANMAYSLLSDTVITVTTAAVNNSGIISVTTPAGTAASASNFVMGAGVPAFLPNPNPFQLCAGNPRLLNTNLAGAFNYVCSNGQSGNAITISSPGSYTLTATDEYGCSNSTNFTVTNYSNCGGYLEIESEPVFNYFDTLTVKIRIKNGINIFSTFAYLNFNTSHLKYVSSTPGDYLGSNVLIQPPVVTGGQIDFGMSHITGDPGTYGDGLIYEFKFVLADQIPNLASFNHIKPNSFTTNLTLSNLSIYNATGFQPPSFAAISMLQKPVACRYYVPVWPGDLNFDRKVNVADITPIGYFYGITGPARPNASLFWTAQPSQLWGFDKSAKNKSAYTTFADGTPDGVINLADQSSIGFNLNKFRLNNVEEPFLRLEQHSDPNLPPLKIDLPSTQIPLASLPANEVATLTLGSTLLPLNNVYGLAFDVFFDPAFVNTAAIITDFSNTIFGTAGVNYTKIEDRSEISSGRFSVGITRFNTTPILANGGTVMKITIPLKSGGSQGLFKVTVIPLTCNDQLGNELLITGTTDSLIVGSLNSCATNTWTGTVSTAWETAGNWSCGSIPGATTIVNIPSGTTYSPVIKSIATCKKLNLLQGATIKVNSGFKLEIVGKN